jgi:3-hydroxyisobutyrate dehydrogenase-like beta-hydroxyacid dehydrogenase
MLNIFLVCISVLFIMIFFSLFKGHSLVVYDTMPQAIEAAVSNGAVAGKTPADVASRVDCVVTMLPNNDIVTNVYTGEDGVFQ